MRPRLELRRTEFRSEDRILVGLKIGQPLRVLAEIDLALSRRLHRRSAALNVMSQRRMG